MTARWLEVAKSAGLASAEGEVRPTIFAEMSALAASADAANLGQGFPDEDGPEWIREIAAEAIRSGVNQYPPGRGILPLREAIASHQLRHYGHVVDPSTEVLVTAGATEALTAAILALAGPGEEVVTLEPFYDSHAAAIAMSGATHRTVGLSPSQDGFSIDREALASVVTERTKLILVNTPHNPTGTVLSREELTLIGEHATRVGATIITDEVYEHLLFDGATHTPMATLPGLRERTLTISSSGKTFSLTGWKIGWVTGPARLIEAVLSIKQFLTYTGGAPFQPAIAAALGSADSAHSGDEDIAELRDRLDARRQRLLDGLASAGFRTVRPQGTYFVCADATPFIEALASEDPVTSHLVTDGASFARWLPGNIGVACVPLSAFCHEGSATGEALRNWVRFTFVKDDLTLDTAIERLQTLRG